MPGLRRNRDDSEDTGQDGNNPQKQQCLQPPGGSVNSETSNVELTAQATGNTKAPQVQKGKRGKGKGTKKKSTKATPRNKIPCNAKKGGKA